MSITAADAEVLLAATEPLPGDLGEAVERLEGIAQGRAFAGQFDADRQPNAATKDAAAIRQVCQAVRQQQAEQPLAERVREEARRKGQEGPLKLTGAMPDFPLPQAEQPEADPELVEDWRDCARYNDRYGMDTDAYLTQMLQNRQDESAAIRQVLKERGETDGQEPQEDPNGPEVTLHLSEIKRLEAERDAYHAQRDKYLQANVDIGKERDEARAEVERLKARTDEDVRAIAEAAMLGYFEGPGCMAVGLPEPSRSSGIKAALAEARKRRPHGTWVAFEKGDQVRSWGPDGIDGKIHDVRLAILVKQGTKHRLEHWGVECATLRPLPPEPEEKCPMGHTYLALKGDKFCRECGVELDVPHAHDL